MSKEILKTIKDAVDDGWANLGGVGSRIHGISSDFDARTNGGPHSREVCQRIICTFQSCSHFMNVGRTLTPDKRRGVSARVGAIVLLLALVLGAGEAQAQADCRGGTPVAGQQIDCREDAGSMLDIEIDAEDLTIETTGQSEMGILGRHEGNADIDIDVQNVMITTDGRDAIGIFSRHEGTGHIDIDVRGGTINTKGPSSWGVYAGHFGTGHVDIDVRDATIIVEGSRDGGIYGIQEQQDNSDYLKIYVEDVVITTKDGEGILGRHEGNADIDIDVQNVMITTDGRGAIGIYSKHEGKGDIDIDVRGGTINTKGPSSQGVYAGHFGTGHVDIDVRDATIIVEGSSSGIYGIQDRPSEGSTEDSYYLKIYAENVVIMTKEGVGIWGNHVDEKIDGDIEIDVLGGTITTEGEDSYGVFGSHQGAPGNLGDLKIKINASEEDGTIATITTITTKDPWAHGVVGWHDANGDIDIDVRSTDITTERTESKGIVGWHRGVGNVEVEVRDTTIETKGTYSYGVQGVHEGTGTVVIDVKEGGAITTEGDHAHGIVINHFGTKNSRTIAVTVGGTVSAGGVGSNGIQAGRVNDGMVEGAAGLGDDGYRGQTVTVNGQVFGGSGEAAGVYLAGGGKVVIGAQGSVRAESGIAILATGDTPGATPTDPPVKPKLHVSVNLNGRQVAAVIGDEYIMNDGGETTIVVNNVTLHDGATGATGLTAPSGAWNVSIQAEGVTLDRTDPDAWVVSERAAGVIADRDFSAGDFTETGLSIVEVYAPRAAVYEYLPGFFLRLNGRGPARERLRSPDMPLWARLSGGNGGYESDQASVGAAYDFERLTVEAGLDVAFPWHKDITGSISVRNIQGLADVESPTGGGDIDAKGFGAEFGASWNGASGHYIDVRFSLTYYDVDLFSDKQGRLTGNASPVVRSPGLETGWRFVLGEKMTLTPRAWVTRSEVSMNRFTDAVDSRISLTNAKQLMSGVGVVAEAGRVWDGGEFTLRGSLDAERTLDGVETAVEVSGEILRSKSGNARILLGLGGVWRWGRISLGCEVSAGGLGSDDWEYAGLLNLGIRF